MNIIRCIVLGIVQGIGEFLPISSSAHLILVPYLLGWKESSMAFDIALHFGTLMAVLVIYFNNLQICCFFRIINWNEFANSILF